MASRCINKLVVRSGGCIVRSAGKQCRRLLTTALAPRAGFSESSSSSPYYNNLWLCPVLAASVLASEACSAEDERAGTPPKGKLRRQITDEYLFSEGKSMGTGKNSTVRTAVHRKTGTLVAVKSIPRYASTEGQVTEEVAMLRIGGQHRNIIKLQDVFSDQGSWYIVMERAKGGELFQRLAEKGAYCEGQAARIMAEVLLAVTFLHEEGIVHFDIKPENIVLETDGDADVPVIRLADFGSAFSKKVATCHARDYTTAYSAPEVLNFGAVDEKADMWALGVLMFVLLSGRHPFDTSILLSEEEVAERISTMEPEYTGKGFRHVSRAGKDLVRRLLSKDPRDRPTAAECLRHEWFDAVVVDASSGCGAGTGGRGRCNVESA